MPTLRSSRNRSEPVTAFVLSGGASLGAVQAGMLRGLYEQQIFPDMLVATSAGALNAGFIATRPRAMQTIDELYEVWRSLRREHVHADDAPAGAAAGNPGGVDALLGRQLAGER